MIGRIILLAIGLSFAVSCKSRHSQLESMMTAQNKPLSSKFGIKNLKLRSDNKSLSNQPSALGLTIIHDKMPVFFIREVDQQAHLTKASGKLPKIASFNLSGHYFYQGNDPVRSTLSHWSEEVREAYRQKTEKSPNSTQVHKIPSFEVREITANRIAEIINLAKNHRYKKITFLTKQPEIHTAEIEKIITGYQSIPQSLTDYDYQTKYFNMKNGDHYAEMIISISDEIK